MAIKLQEPFGYFKAEPFGWRDCAETDEGAIALYEAPQPQADARDAERWSEIGKSIERACGELPEDFEITIHLENGAGTVVLLYPNGEECENFPHDDGFAGVVNAAIDAAIAAAEAAHKQHAQPQADARDAERWRFIKRKLCLSGNGDGTCAMQALNLPARILGWPDVGELAMAQFLDTAIDAAIAEKENK